MQNMITYRKTKQGQWVALHRRFGRCSVPGCRTRRVVEGSIINGQSIHYSGLNRDSLRHIMAWCEDHDRPLDWTQLRGRVNPDKECNGICMGAVGPSCTCACGGENHGKNHLPA
ncbi:hypothetical protein PJN91_17510 [Mycobacterium kansasii]